MITIIKSLIRPLIIWVIRLVRSLHLMIKKRSQLLLELLLLYLLNMLINIQIKLSKKLLMKIKVKKKLKFQLCKKLKMALMKFYKMRFYCLKKRIKVIMKICLIIWIKINHEDLLIKVKEIVLEHIMVFLKIINLLTLIKLVKNKNLMMVLGTILTKLWKMLI